MTTTPGEAAGDSRGHVLDALIVGAGMTGIYQLFRLRSIGFDVEVVEAGGGVGGTWHWNRYPGARFDSESYSYGYFFSKELVDEWSWTEHFAGQPEIERYLNYVVDRFDLRDHINLNAKVESATWSEDTRTWSTVDQHGRTYESTFLITAIGILSAPQYPSAPGRELFRGESYHTARWPSRKVEFRDRRVAVIGTGASGVQLIQTVADEVRSLLVLQRTPNWCTPLRNTPITDEEQQRIKASMDEIYRSTRNQTGFIHGPYPSSAFDHTADERWAIYEKLYETPGLAKLYGNFKEVILDAEINMEFSEFLAAKIAARIHNPAVAAKLIPTDHGYGIKRPPMETHYYEAFNRPNVELVDLLENPLEAITPDGLRLADGTEHELDLIVYATGFDAVTGAFDRIDFVGSEGQSLKDAWANGPRTFLGMQSPGFPNAIFVGGPQSVAGNFPRSTERQVEFVAELLVHAREKGIRRIEPRTKAVDDWVEEVARAVAPTLLDKYKKHWSFGGNTPGKVVVHRNYAGGMLTYAQRCDEVVESQFAAFVFD
jgi:cation diffusion facilitator CzcD-associated flavoprotein CzcO